MSESLYRILNPEVKPGSFFPRQPKGEYRFSPQEPSSEKLVQQQPFSHTISEKGGSKTSELTGIANLLKAMKPTEEESKETFKTTSPLNIETAEETKAFLTNMDSNLRSLVGQDWRKYHNPILLNDQQRMGLSDMIKAISSYRVNYIEDGLKSISQTDPATKKVYISPGQEQTFSTLLAADENLHSLSEILANSIKEKVIDPDNLVSIWYRAGEFLNAVAPAKKTEGTIDTDIFSALGFIPTAETKAYGDIEKRIGFLDSFFHPFIARAMGRVENIINSPIDTLADVEARTSGKISPSQVQREEEVKREIEREVGKGITQLQTYLTYNFPGKDSEKLRITITNAIPLWAAMYGLSFPNIKEQALDEAKKISHPLSSYKPFYSVGGPQKMFKLTHEEQGLPTPSLWPGGKFEKSGYVKPPQEPEEDFFRSKFEYK